MRVLITGITGYIGSHLAKNCVNRGWKVYGLVRQNSKTELLKKNGILKKIKLKQFSSGVEELAGILRETKPDLVFHLATLYIAEHRSDQTTSLIDANIRFGGELLEAMKVVGINSFVSAETTWQYDPCGNVRPVNLYAATKQAFSIINHYYADVFGIRTVKLKLFDTYGGNDNRPKLFNKLREISRTGEKLELSKGEQILDFTHIDDVVSAFVVGAKRVLQLESGEIEEYVITGERLPMKDWIKKIDKILGKPLPVVLGAKPYRMREVMVPWSGGKKLKGWKSRKTIDQGLKEFFL